MKNNENMKYDFKAFIDKIGKINSKDVKISIKNKMILIQKGGKTFRQNISKKEFDETIKGYNKNIIEYKISSQIVPLIFFPNREKFKIENDKCNIEITKMSDYYFIDCFMRANISDIKIKFLFLLDDFSKHKKMTFMEFIRSFIDINSEQVAKLTKKKGFKGNADELIESYLVNISINTGAVYIIDNDKKNAAFKNNFKIINNQKKQLEIPRRKYRRDLAKNYQLAKAANNPMLQFLSYYHVLECLFNSVYDQHAIDELKKIVTSPKFMYDSDNSYKNILRAVEKSYQYKEDRGIYKSDKVALKLVLEKYIELSDIKAFLNSNNGIFYQNNDAYFSKSSKLNPNDDKALYSLLAKRIYDTRNTLVHITNSQQISYTPFQDEDKVWCEIPLINFLAEEVLINSSTILEQ